MSRLFSEWECDSRDLDAGPHSVRNTAEEVDLELLQTPPVSSSVGSGCWQAKVTCSSVPLSVADIGCTLVPLRFSGGTGLWLECWSLYGSAA